MSRRCTLPVDAPETAEDRRLERSRTRQHATLLQMQEGPRSIEQLMKAVIRGMHMPSMPTFVASVLDPLAERGLVEPGPSQRRARDQQWCLTAAGRREARREAEARAREAAESAESAASTPGAFAIAQRREPLHPFEPLPAGEYRVQRPGAYAHEAWPSRHGDWLHYRDGRVVHVNERGDA